MTVIRYTDQLGSFVQAELDGQAVMMPFDVYWELVPSMTVTMSGPAEALAILYLYMRSAIVGNPPYVSVTSISNPMALFEAPMLTQVVVNGLTELRAQYDKDMSLSA